MVEERVGQGVEALVGIGEAVVDVAPGRDDDMPGVFHLVGHRLRPIGGRHRVHLARNEQHRGIGDRRQLQMTGRQPHARPIDAGGTLRPQPVIAECRFARRRCIGGIVHQREAFAACDGEEHAVGPHV